MCYEIMHLSVVIKTNQAITAIPGGLILSVVRSEGHY